MAMKEKLAFESHQAYSNRIIIVTHKDVIQSCIARILRIPSEIEKEISKDTKQLMIGVNARQYKLNINTERTYLGGVTQLYKNEGLIIENNVFVPKKAIWHYSKENINIEIKGENE